MRMDFTCLLYVSAAHQFQNANTIFHSLARLSTLSISFTDSSRTHACVCALSVLPVWHIYCCAYLSSETTILSTLLHLFPYPFRYLFNLIWFRFQVFSRLRSFSRFFIIIRLHLSLCLIDQSLSRFLYLSVLVSCQQFVLFWLFCRQFCHALYFVSLNYLKLIKSSTWILFSPCL